MERDRVVVDFESWFFIFKNNDWRCFVRKIMV